MKAERVLDYVPFREALPGWGDPIVELPQPERRKPRQYRRPRREDYPRTSRAWSEPLCLWM